MTINPGHSRNPGSDGPGSAELDAALRQFAQRPQILVALDFDGVLAPFVRDPDAAAPMPSSVAAVHRLSRAGVHIAYISGRPLADLRSRAEAPAGAVFVGSHGAEVAMNGDDGADADAVELSTDEADRLAALNSRLASALSRTPNTWLESKPAGVVVHTRGADEDEAARALEQAREAAADFPTVKVTKGHHVLEFALRHSNKGEGLSRVRSSLRPEAVLFAGDDTTDEDAFAILRPEDVGIKVGPGETAARYRVRDPQQVSDVLEQLAELVESRDG
ncbi:trehalose-phosphatase [Saxibacter everestensis]|uniref:Trehalose 6-phosphate phosphatase n=1 Tax=Saxibacter everestensis TaxID=2909229 RepID=A0ABY8QU98_9MICO|nr:trehalose-phosphatase [Brevibacteriaceae bacterium ZFBP1038]